MGLALGIFVCTAQGCVNTEVPNVLNQSIAILTSRLIRIEKKLRVHVPKEEIIIVTKTK